MRSVCVISVILFFTSSCSAQWQLIDDFQQWIEGAGTPHSIMVGWYTICEQDNDYYLMFPDRYDDENICFCIDSYMESTLNPTVFASKELPGGGIVPDGTGTLFFRCTWDNFSGSWYIGTTDVDIVYDEASRETVSPGQWDDFNALFRINSEGVIRHRDGDTYVASNPQFAMGVEHWYSFWIVVENSWDYSTTPPTSTGHYTLYVQGPGIGDGLTPTLIPVGTSPEKEIAAFGRIPIDEQGNPRPIKNLFIASNNGIPRSGPSDRHYYDDFNFSEGVNLSMPPSVPEYRMFGEWFVDESRDRAWTGFEFLYILNISQAPLIWAYQIKSWIYLEETAITESGAWVYFYK